MKDSYKNRIALILMNSSLLLLLLFIGLWLRSSYTQEKNHLKEKSSFIFINALRDAETKLLKKVLWSTIHNMPKIKPDSITIMAYNMKQAEDDTIALVFNNSDSTHVQFESKVEVKISDSLPDFSIKQDGGIIIQLLTELRDSQYLPITPNKHRDSLILASINHIVTESPKIQEIPNPFRVIKFKDSLSQFSNIISDTYEDFESGEKFALKVDNIEHYILKQLVPQLLFSILLFSITLLAFFFIYRNLKRQQQLMDLKNDLISNITHELKTPISTVGVAIEALQSFGALEDPIKTKEYLDISRQELNRLSILVDKVLNTSLFEKTDFKLKKEEINLKDLIGNVLNSMKLQFQNRKALIDFRVEGQQFLFNGDRLHLTSVIYNLLDNALKYSPKIPQIVIALEATQQELILSVKDKGWGIPQAYQDKVFEKFFRIPTGNKHNIKGHGLGLSYVKEIIDKHQGQIQLQSTEGEGTCFKISLPILMNDEFF